MKSLLLMPMLVLAVACGQKGGSGSGKKINQIFVKGNPLTMVSGTTKNKTSFFTPSNYQEFSQYVLSGIYIFTEKELITNEETEDIEAGQEAEENDQTQVAATIFNLINTGSNEYALEDQKGQISFGFHKSGSTLALESLKLGTQEFDAAIEHYSITPDKSKFSLLLKLRTKGDGDILLSATFNKALSKVAIPKVSTQYHYLYGKGVVVPWKLDATRIVRVDVCPSMAEYRDFSEVKAAIKAWEAPFGAYGKSLEIDVKLLDSCRPFSDVNEHSIHYVEKYLTMPNKDAYNPGFTMIHSDFNRGNIFDADIVILGSEIKKDPNYGATQSNRTITHEIGHFLGLDHQFDGPVSIMSYDQVYKLGQYDNEAIVNLYWN